MCRFPYSSFDSRPPADETQADPQDKLFTFQFPNLFPHFSAAGPVDLTAEDTKAEAKPDIKPDVKATVSRKAADRKKGPSPDGRVGTMVIMKSGRVKLVLGTDIVLNVSLPRPLCENFALIESR